MRLMQVVHGFPPSATGGTEIYAHDLAMELNHLFGDEVMVLAREAAPDRPELSVRFERRNGIRIAYINNTFKLCRSFEQTYRQDGVRRVAAELMDEVQPEVVHFHHLTGLSTDLVSEASRRNVPTLFTLHDYWLLCQRGQLLDLDYRQCAGPSPTRCVRCVGQAAGAGPAAFHGASLLRALEHRLPGPGRLARGVASHLGGLWAESASSEAIRQMERRLDHVQEICSRVTRFLAPSRTVLQRFLEFGIREERITHAELGIDHSRFLGLGRQRERTTAALKIGYVGSLMASKGVHLLLEAYGNMPAGSATVHVYGDPASYHGDESYEQLITPLLRQPGVFHEGAVEHERIPSILASLDVLVVPSTWLENAPLVVREAFLAGVPVIASRLGGLTEVVKHEVNGLFFRPGDARDLQGCLQRLATEPRLLDRLRDGIPRVRTLSEDARFLRGLYLDSLPTGDRFSIQSHAVRRRPRLAAVVLNYGTPEDTVESVQALQQSRRPLDDVVVVDNASEDGSEAHLRRHLPEVTVIQTGENLGFSGGNNVGIRFALLRGADQVLLVNSDVTLDPDCTGHMERALRQSDERGIAGPSVLARSDPNMVASLGITFSPTTCRMLHLGFGQQFDAGEVSAVSEVDGVSGCAMMIKREVLQRIGLLSEEYFFSFEDLDLCLRARKAGFQTICVGPAVAYHEGGRSIGKRSPRRIYFATRNHMLMADRVAKTNVPPVALVRNGFITGLNLAHVLLTADTPRREGLEAMVQGIWHHVWKRYGDGP